LAAALDPETEEKQLKKKRNLFSIGKRKNSDSDKAATTVDIEVPQAEEDKVMKPSSSEVTIEVF
jgi:hypothetical protein